MGKFKIIDQIIREDPLNLYYYLKGHSSIPDDEIEEYAKKLKKDYKRNKKRKLLFTNLEETK